MLKKLVATVIATSAMTIPLAGTAWADPSANSNGVGAKGVPGVINEQYYQDPTKDQVPPGNPVSGTAITKPPQTSLVDANAGQPGQLMKKGLYGGVVNNGGNNGRGAPNCC
jgi:hypothetical protein